MFAQESVMDIQEKKVFDAYFKEKYPELYKDVFDEDGDDRAIIGYSFAWSAWQAKAQAVPKGFALVRQKDLLELTIAINAVDLATHTESKTNEVREMWQQVAIKLMALGTTQEPAND